MIGLDTNFLVRFYTSDDVKQSPLAAEILQRPEVFYVPKSVVLELFWVLTSVHKTSPPRLIEVLRHLLALEHVRVEDERSVKAAVDSYEQGLAFEDALHLASCSECNSMLTFDRPLAKRAARLGLTPVCEFPQ